jgi:hypothetical protein
VVRRVTDNCSVLIEHSAIKALISKQIKITRIYISARIDTMAMQTCLAKSIRCLEEEFEILRLGGWIWVVIINTRLNVLQESIEFLKRSLVHNLILGHSRKPKQSQPAKREKMSRTKTQQQQWVKTKKNSRGSELVGMDEANELLHCRTQRWSGGLVFVSLDIVGRSPRLVCARMHG